MTSLVTWISGRPTLRDAVVIPCDAMAFPFALFLARQIAQAETARRFDVVVAVNDRAAVPPAPDAPGVLLAELGPDPRLLSLPRTRKISHASYYWIVLTGALAGTYRRVLFLDADIWLRRPGLGALFGDAPLPHAVAAAPAGTEYHDRGTGLTRFHEREGLPASHVYRNGGVELVDLQRAVAEGIPDRLIDFRRNLGPKIASTDQTAMNVVLAGDLALLSPRWNFLTLPASRHLVEPCDAVLLHYADNPKPWVRVEGVAPDPEYAAYKDFLDAGFPPGDLLRRGIWGAQPPLPNPGNPLARWLHGRKVKARAAENLARRAVLDAAPRASAEVVQRYIGAADL